MAVHRGRVWRGTKEAKERNEEVEGARIPTRVRESPLLSYEVAGPESGRVANGKSIAANIPYAGEQPLEEWRLVAWSAHLMRASPLIPLDPESGMKMLSNRNKEMQHHSQMKRDLGK